MLNGCVVEKKQKNNHHQQHQDDYIGGEWSEPVVWSMFGVNGKDGDGVEYIFLKNNGEEIPLNPTPIDWGNERSIPI